MKRLGSLGLLLLIIQMGRAEDAVQIFPQWPFPATGTSTNGAAFAFRAKVPLLITALRYDFTPNIFGLSTGRVDFLNASGQILATAFMSTNVMDSGADHVEIHPPLVIPAGTTNFLRGSVILSEPPPFPTSEFLWFGGLVPTNQTAIARELDYLGTGRGFDLSGYSMEYFLMGANFRFETIPLMTLQISITSSNHVRLSWPAAGDYVLHSGPAPDAPMTPVLVLPELIGTERVVTVPMQTTDCFFRLVR